MAKTVPFINKELAAAETYIPPASNLSVLQASAQDALASGSFGALMRIGMTNYLEDEGPIVDVDTLRKELPETNIHEPMTRAKAEYLAKEQSDDRRRKSILANSADNFFSSQVVPFAGGLVGSIVDPIDLSIGAALGGLNMAAKSGQLALKLGTLGKVGNALLPAAKALKYTTETAGVFGTNLAEAIFSNAVTETLNYKAHKDINVEYTAEDALKNVFISSIAMTGFMHGVSTIFRKLTKIDPSALDNLYKYADEQLKEGVNPDLKTIETSLEKLSVNDEIALIVRDSFDEATANRILNEKEMLPEIGREFRDLHSEGKISPDQVASFLQKVEAAGYSRTSFNPDMNNLEIDSTSRTAMGAEGETPEKRLFINDEGVKAVEEAHANAVDALASNKRMAADSVERLDVAKTKLKEGMFSPEAAEIVQKSVDMAKKEEGFFTKVNEVMRKCAGF